MFTTIAKWSMLFSALIGIQAFVNYVLPREMLSSAVNFFSYIWLLDGFIPVSILFNCVIAVIALFTVKMVYNIIFGFIGLFSGSGRPEI